MYGLNIRIILASMLYNNVCMCTCFVGVCADVPKAKRGNDGDAKKIAICFKIIET